MSGTHLFLEMSKGEAAQVSELIAHAAQITGRDSDKDLSAVLAKLGPMLTAESDSQIVEAAGAAFGEMLARTAKLDWIMVFDEYGLNIGLQQTGMSLVCFPLDMIAKRVEQGDSLDLGELVNSTVAAIESTEVGPYAHADFVQCVYGLHSIDLAMQHKEGGYEFVLVTVGSMIDDPRTIRLLERKLASYEQFAKTEYPGEPVCIRLVAGDEPGPMIRVWIEKQIARLREASLELVLEIKPQAQM